jgi:DNA polymerase-3 subunit gamma/tau
VRALASQADAPDLVRLQRGFAQGFDDVSRSADPRAALEMLLVRLALRPALIPLDSLVARLSELEARLGAPAASPGRAGGPPGAAGRSPSRPSRTRDDATAPRASSAAPAEPSVDAGEPNAREKHGARSADVTTAPDSRRPGSTSRPLPAKAERSDSSPTVASPAVASPIDSSPVVASPIVASGPTSPVAASGAVSAPAASDASDPVARWRQVLDLLDASRPDLVAFLKHAVPIRVDAESLVLGYQPGNVLEASVKSQECLSALGEAARACLGRSPPVRFEAVDGKTETLADVDRKRRQREQHEAMQRAQTHQSVLDATEILGARVKRVELGER